MAEKKHTYRLETVSHSPFINQMNVYLCIASFTEGLPKADTVRYQHEKPAKQDQVASIETEVPVDFITIAIYVVSQEYPQSDIVADSPDFALEYRVLKDGSVIDTQILNINHWGGAQLINIRYE